MDAVRLDVLNNLRIASPCPARWEDMAGDDRTRFCSQCQLHVHNLSAMTAEEAAAFVVDARSRGRGCVRFYRRADGTVLTRDCPVGWRAVRQRMRKRVERCVAAALLLVGFGGVALGGSRTQGAMLSGLRPYRLLAELLGAPTGPAMPAITGDVCRLAPIAPNASLSQPQPLVPVDPSSQLQTSEEQALTSLVPNQGR
jgi:hypothetical protein